MSGSNSPQVPSSPSRSDRSPIARSVLSERHDHQARRLLARYPELALIGAEIKEMGLDAEEAVDLALASVARFLGDRIGPVPEPEEGTLKSIAESVARIEDRLASGLERPLGEAIGPLVERLSKIEGDLTALTQQRAAKDYYSTEDVARIVGRSDYTVREWCRYGRLRAVKRKCGRGRSAEWSIPHGELVRYQNEGLLPM